MTVETLIEILSSVSDKTRQVKCIESDFKCRDEKDFYGIREVATSDASQSVRIYVWA